jgi:hypothetical protein
MLISAVILTTSLHSQVIPGGLNPIGIDVEKGEGIDVEPNVWMVHEIR